MKLSRQNYQTLTQEVRNSNLYYHKFLDVKTTTQIKTSNKIKKIS